MTNQLAVHNPIDVIPNFTRLENRDRSWFQLQEHDVIVAFVKIQPCSLFRLAIGHRRNRIEDADGVDCSTVELCTPDHVDSKLCIGLTLTTIKQVS